VDAPEQHGVSVVCCWLLEMEWAAAEPLKLANCFAGVACKIPTGLAAGAGGVPKCAGKAAAVAGKAPAAAGEPSAAAGGHDADVGKLGTGAG